MMVSGCAPVDFSMSSTCSACRQSFALLSKHSLVMLLVRYTLQFTTIHPAQHFERPSVPHARMRGTDWSQRAASDRGAPTQAPPSAQRRAGARQGPAPGAGPQRARTQ